MMKFDTKIGIVKRCNNEDEVTTIGTACEDNGGDSEDDFGDNRGETKVILETMPLMVVEVE